jgi:hypothetical protein
VTNKFAFVGLVTNKFDYPMTNNLITQISTLAFVGLPVQTGQVVTNKNSSLAFAVLVTRKDSSPVMC